MARVLLLDGDEVHDVFDVVEVGPDFARVRTAYLYEVGEELRVRVAGDAPSDAATDMTARVRAHTGEPTARITELELTR